MWNDLDENRSGEDVRKKSQRQRSDSDEFPHKVEPSHEDIYHFFGEVRSGGVPEVVSKVSQKSLVANANRLRDENNREGHHDGRIEVWINRS